MSVTPVFLWMNLGALTVSSVFFHTLTLSVSKPIGTPKGQISMRRVVKNGASGSRQAHMNTVKYDPNKHRQKVEQLSDEIISVMTTLCCRRCCEIIQWKVDYGKYVPQEMARKCNLCAQRTVRLAYHRICRGCAVQNARCAKCQKPASELIRRGSSEDSEEESENLNGDANDRPLYGKGDDFCFLAEEPKHEELKSLCGLDVRALEREIESALRREREEQIRCLPERKRRTALRTQEQNRDVDDESDELL